MTSIMFLLQFLFGSAGCEEKSSVGGLHRGMAHTAVWKHLSKFVVSTTVLLSAFTAEEEV